MDDARFRLTDAQLQRFLVDGYLVLRPNLPEGFHRRVYERLAAVMEQTGNPYNNLLPEVPELGQVFCHPEVTGALASILGDGYYLNLHRRCHDRTAGTEAQDMHQDSLHNSRYAVDGTRRHHHVRWAMAFYYPQDTDERMGPTAVVPRSQYLNQPQRDADAIPLAGAAGTVVIVHYDIWHRATAYVSGDRVRYMVKFLFTRMADPRRPSWRHDAAGGAPRWPSPGAEQTSGGVRALPFRPSGSISGAGISARPRTARRQPSTAAWRAWPIDSGRRTNRPRWRRRMRWAHAAPRPPLPSRRRCAAATSGCSTTPRTASHRLAPPRCPRWAIC